ncbi:ABC transporter permease [Actinoplanes sp. NPDC051513]|uniref:ABC transporter permease n=1 Tax=Actinoplanes sp. NPDC051513 TaxID=3363908 RepID=UPI0037B1D342
MASDAAGRDAPPGEAAAHHRSVAPPDLAWPAGYRPKGTEPAIGGTPPAGSPAVDPRRRNLAGLGLGALRVGPALMLLVVVLVASALSPVFFTTRNLGNVFSQTAVIAILALAQLLVIVTRGIDLSVGSTLALSAVVGALVFDAVPSGPLVILAMLATGTAVGAVNGAVLVWGRLPHPFIMTLAMLSIARGLALWLSGGQPIAGMPPVVQRIGGGALGWLPYSAFLVAGLALLTLLLTKSMVWGRWIFAVGGNPDAARRAAIPVNGVTVSVYVLSGLAAGIAGMVNAGRLDGGSPTFGELAELDAIAAVVIGGASFHGGRGHVGNALVGALMIGVIRNAMNLLDVNAFLQPIVIGVVIVLAVELDVLRGSLEGRLRILQAARS